MKTQFHQILILASVMLISIILPAQVDVDPHKVDIRTDGSGFLLNFINQAASISYDLNFHAQENLSLSETNQAPRLFIKKGGKVGLGGTLNPTAQLHVIADSTSSPDSNGIYLFNPIEEPHQRAVISARVAGAGGGDPLISLDISDESGWSIGIDNDDENRLKISNHWEFLESLTKVTIQSDGKFGIGTTTPTEILDVNGGARIRNVPAGSGNTLVIDINGNIRQIVPALPPNNDGSLDQLRESVLAKDNEIAQLKAKNENLESRLSNLEKQVEKIIKGE